MTTAHALSRVRKAEGLYDPAFEHDSCGVAFVATLTGIPSHDIIAQGLEALRNLDHRGAVGADPKTGDGAGMLLQIPDGFFRSEVDFELPRQGAYAVGNAFLPTDPELAAKAKASIEQIASEENLSVLGWRRVPTNDSTLSDLTRSNMPYFEQLFLTAKGAPLDGHRAGPAGLLPAAQGRARDRHLLRIPVLPDHRLQGHVDHRTVAPGLPGAAG